MKHFFNKKKKPQFDYYDDMEIAQEFSFDPFSEEPRSLSHKERKKIRKLRVPEEGASEDETGEEYK